MLDIHYASILVDGITHVPEDSTMCDGDLLCYNVKEVFKHLTADERAELAYYLWENGYKTGKADGRKELLDEMSGGEIGSEL